MSSEKENNSENNTENETKNKTEKEEMKEKEMEEMQMREETGKAVWKSKVRKRTKSVRR